VVEKDIRDYKLENGVNKANFNTYKIIYNWQLFLERVYILQC